MNKIFVLVFSMALLLLGCDSSNGPMPVDCSTSDLEISIQSFQNASGCAIADGSVTVVATGGDGNFMFRLESGSLQPNESFLGLLPGKYRITVMDGLGCERKTEVTIISSGGVSITNIDIAESGCGLSNGMITVTASGGSSFMYKLNSGAYVSGNSFEGLQSGNYLVTVKNDQGCEFSDMVFLPTGIPFSTIKSIISNNCAVSGCHNGTQFPDFTKDQNIIANASNIRTQTQSGAMPQTGSLTNEQIAQIACWVDDGANPN